MAIYEAYDFRYWFILLFACSQELKMRRTISFLARLFSKKKSQVTVSAVLSSVVVGLLLAKTLIFS